jgi:hypothetical protein
MNVKVQNQKQFGHLTFGIWHWISNKMDLEKDSS